MDIQLLNKKKLGPNKNHIALKLKNKSIFNSRIKLNILS